MSNTTVKQRPTPTKIGTITNGSKKGKGLVIKGVRNMVEFGVSEVSDLRCLDPKVGQFHTFCGCLRLPPIFDRWCT